MKERGFQFGSAKTHRRQNSNRAGSLFREDDFTGDENAIVDFKYSSSPRVTWWFDHHLSAFLTPEDHQRFLRGQADGSQSQRHFDDPAYTSCTGVIAHIECRLEAVMAGGDHDIVTGRPLSVGEGPGLAPLLFFRSQYGGFSG